MDRLAEQNAILQAQVDALSGDDELRREAAIWRGVSPAECLAVTFALCDARPPVTAGAVVAAATTARHRRGRPIPRSRRHRA